MPNLIMIATDATIVSNTPAEPQSTALTQLANTIRTQFPENDMRIFAPSRPTSMVTYATVISTLLHDEWDINQNELLIEHENHCTCAQTLHQLDALITAHMKGSAVAVMVAANIVLEQFGDYLLTRHPFWKQLLSKNLVRLPPLADSKGWIFQDNPQSFRQILTDDVLL